MEHSKQPVGMLDPVVAARSIEFYAELQPYGFGFTAANFQSSKSTQLPHDCYLITLYFKPLAYLFYLQ